VQYKEYPEDWAAARTKTVSADAERTVTLEQLNPGSTYNFRIAQGDSLSDDLVVDTQCALSLLSSLRNSPLLLRSAELHAESAAM